MLTVMGGFVLLGAVALIGGISGSVLQALRVFILLWGVMLAATTWFSVTQADRGFLDQWQERALGFAVPALVAWLLALWIGRPPRPPPEPVEEDDYDGYHR
ncbi:hypothetical protein BKE38_00390 [Pseudoroseomonas deserti]|uniref:Uncharacterized protein n=1 Tax=Teichococcus deserti TaxID=1817963 RepID=A0A1V2HB44_9PROT|nr:hypothetical protein [Pseudoroseomonas deserti]ONG59166.1 hypothetical protein BKE38_00390 [Pseudoroseomonas deserti]